MRFKGHREAVLKRLEKSPPNLAEMAKAELERREARRGRELRLVYIEEMQWVFHFTICAKHFLFQNSLECYD